MHLLRLFLLLCLSLPECHPHPHTQPNPILSPSHLEPFSHPDLPPPPNRIPKRTTPDSDSSDDSVGSSNPGASGPALSPEDHVPSSSGAFTPVLLPAGWEIHPVSSAIVMSPVRIVAAALEHFYEGIIEVCARNLFSRTPPDAPLLNTSLRMGALLLTVLGDEKGGGGGVPWGVLALLAQGMLERARRYVLFLFFLLKLLERCYGARLRLTTFCAFSGIRRGWTSTWDGLLISPENAQYRIVLHVEDDEPDLLCDEGPVTESESEGETGGGGCKGKGLGW
ncbi:MAG: hypothetical protein LQ338_003841 [Usnochroma carphineum]|nr:MAG: hypothetical protein LQ338_003841 [Usnochroma carphineum]